MIEQEQAATTQPGRPPGPPASTYWLSTLILACGYFGLTLTAVNLLSLSLPLSMLALLAIGAPELGLYFLLRNRLSVRRGNFARGPIRPWWRDQADTSGMCNTAGITATSERIAA